MMQFSGSILFVFFFVFSLFFYIYVNKFFNFLIQYDEYKKKYINNNKMIALVKCKDSENNINICINKYCLILSFE